MGANFMRFLFYCVALVFLFPHTSFAEEKPCEEQIRFSLDDRDWQEAYHKTNDENEGITEFVLKGENVENWSELIAVQKFNVNQGSLEEYYDLFMKNLKEAVKPDQVHSRIIKKDKDTLLFEWWIDKPSSNAQHEWFKIFKTPQSLMILRYVTKKLDKVEKQRPIWEKILEDASYSTEGKCS